MPLLKVATQDEQRTLTFVPGASLREILDVTNIRVRSGCRGNGICGLCHVVIEEGSVNKPSANERLLLTPEMLRCGIRLACQIFPLHDLSIRIDKAAPKSDWRSLSADEYFEPLSNFHKPDNPGSIHSDSLGIAVDLWTTHVSATLWDRVAGKRLTGRTGLNQQLLFGSDVMTRIVCASESRELSHEISQLAVDAMGKAILDICSREGYDSRRISHVSIVGNTPELALLSEKNYDLLLQPKYWTSEIDCQPEDSQQWCMAWNISPDAEVHVVSPLAGFIGSDLLAGIIATGMEKNSPVSLLIDFGTNTEIALWDGDNLWATSAAGGPAFEGSGLSCGMPAVPGAVYNIEYNPTHHDFNFQVIAGDDPKGICGSGLIDLLAYMLRTGVINAKGKFTPALTHESFVLPVSHMNIAIKPQDIDVLQRAKAAIGAGIQCLLQSAGISVKQLQKIYVCGVFGRFLNIRNTQQIGLLPPISENAFQLCGNTALAGCEMLLLSPAVEQKLSALRKKSRVINMSNYFEFDTLFLENLYLRPSEVE